MHGQLPKAGVRCRIGALVVALIGLLAGCGSDEPTIPKVTVTAGDVKSTLDATLYCVDGHAKLGADDAKTPAMQVKPDQQVKVSVPAAVADVGWTIQIWSVADGADGAVPSEQIGNIDVGTARSFDGFTTSDAVPDRYFIIVALPEDPKCDAQGSAGIWTVLVSRVA